MKTVGDVLREIRRVEVMLDKVDPVDILGSGIDGEDLREVLTNYIFMLRELPIKK